SRRTAWTARYEEDTSTTSQVQLERQLISLVDAFGEPIVDPTSGANIAIPVNTATITDEVFVRRLFQGSVSARGRRTTASLNIFAERREFQLSGDEETVYGISANASRRLSPRTNLSASTSWQESEARATGLDSTRWDVGFAVNHRLGRDLSGTLNYLHVEQDSGAGGSDYSENRFTVGLDLLF
ncbi:MAG: hypothetical protein DRQ37_08595, partial [Gammaproteobacteria bacterium]